jgi:hypothetical protein
MADKSSDKSQYQKLFAQSKEEKWKTIISGLALTISIVALGLSYMVFHGDHESRRRVATVDMLFKAEGFYQNIRPSIKASFHDLLADSIKTPLSVQEAQNLYNACNTSFKQQSGRHFDCEARRVAGALLNLDEMIATAYMYSVVDREATYYQFGQAMESDLRYFKEFIAIVTEARHSHSTRKAWKCLQETVDDMHRTYENTPVLKDKTG